MFAIFNKYCKVPCTIRVVWRSINGFSIFFFSFMKTHDKGNLLKIDYYNEIFHFARSEECKIMNENTQTKLRTKESI